jgi:hypothetical protein
VIDREQGRATAASRHAVAPRSILPDDRRRLDEAYDRAIVSLEVAFATTCR